MNFRDLYTSFDGRISRKPLWLGMIGLVVVGIAISLLIVAPVTLFSPTVGSLLGLLISLALLYPACALGVKRLHDRGKSGHLMAVFIAPGLIYQIADLLGLVSREVTVNGQILPVPTALGSALGLVTLVVAIWALVALGLRKGTPGTNAYGPSPVDTPQAVAAETI